MGIFVLFKYIFLIRSAVDTLLSNRVELLLIKRDAPLTQATYLRGIPLFLFLYFGGPSKEIPTHSTFWADKSTFQSDNHTETPAQFLSVSHTFIGLPPSKTKEVETMDRWGPEYPGYRCYDYIHKQDGVCVSVCARARFTTPFSNRQAKHL